MKIKLFNRKFPFKDSPNTLCITCCHILNENKPVLYVSHDDDGCWQFLCGEQHIQEDARVVSLSEIIVLNKNIVQLSDLKLGEYAEMKNNKWITHKKHNIDNPDRH